MKFAYKNDIIIWVINYFTQMDLRRTKTRPLKILRLRHNFAKQMEAAQK